MPVNTAKVAGRRKLAYGSFHELLDDADRLTSGPIKTLGNWSAGQIFRHLATAYNSSIDGFTLTFPWYLRAAGKLFKNKLVNGPMPAGFKLPKKSGKSLVPPEVSDDEGLAELYAAVERLKREPNRARHPLFGALSNDEWNKIHLAHASLHMSFLAPQ
jgi:Protein of unknown function (DUF1569)